MASISAALHRIRRVRREMAPPETDSWEAYRPAYRRTFEALEAVAGEEGVDRLHSWVITEVDAAGRLPTPESVRERAAAICRALGQDVPAVLG